MSLADLLGIDLPIVQAPMASAQGSAMAIAVSNAGGLGSVPCALLTPDGLRKEAETMRAGTTKPFNVNFFCHTLPVHDAAREAAWRLALAPYYEELGIDPATIPSGPARASFDAEFCDALEELRPAVVSFHFGLPPDDLLRRVKSCGSKVFSSATTVDEATWLEARGVDAVIAQGVEAGGHRGMFLSNDVSTQVGTFALLPQVVRAVSVPVIAAGGIASSRGVRAALDLGASGVQIGTAYLLCPEATTTPVHRAALKSQRARETALTNLFTGRPARAIVNRLMRELGAMGMGNSLPAFPLAAYSVVPLRVKAEAGGSGEFSPLWSGQNATGCKEIPAGELTRELAADL